MRTGIALFDYCSFLIECDELEFQAMWLPEWQELLVNRLGAEEARKCTKVTALGSRKGGQRRYIFAIWGRNSDRVRNLPFQKWGMHLTRMDVRTTIYECTADTFERLVVALEHADTRNNVESFKVSKRTKSSARDAGGRGVRYGSRKSDISSKLYRRGGEHPAIETQVQDDILAEECLKVLETMELCEYTIAGWPTLGANLQAIQRKHIRRWLVQSGMDVGIDALRHDDIPMPAKLQAMFQRDLFYGGNPPAHEPPAEPQDSETP